MATTRPSRHRLPAVSVASTCTRMGARSVATLWTSVFLAKVASCKEGKKASVHYHRPPYGLNARIHPLQLWVESLEEL